jgi:hypothetical protein
MRRLILAAAAAIAIILAGCSDDDPVGPPTSRYKDLSQEWHVLNNLEAACNDKNAGRYREILDESRFRFVFDQSADEVPRAWCFGEDILSVQNIFDGDGGLYDNPVLTVWMTIPDLEETRWGDHTSADFPGEPLRRAIVQYQLRVKTSNEITFVSPIGAHAEFVVRNGGGKWKIVQWSDLPPLAATPSYSLEEVGWSRIKVLYPGNPEYRDPCVEWNVLHNLERAYDTMNVDCYSELFDPDKFVFFPDPSDVGKDGVPNQWYYEKEIQSATNMFSGAGGRDDNPITSIDVTLYDIEEAQWEDEINDIDFPGETLRKATVDYTFTIDTVGDKTFVAPSVTPRAQFIVRNIDGKGKLVQWFDLRPSSTTLMQPGALAGSEETSWARVKALYR